MKLHCYFALLLAYPFTLSSVPPRIFMSQSQVRTNVGEYEKILYLGLQTKRFIVLPSFCHLNRSLCKNKIHNIFQLISISFHVFSSFSYFFKYLETLPLSISTFQWSSTVACSRARPGRRRRMRSRAGNVSRQSLWIFGRLLQSCGFWSLAPILNLQRSTYPGPAM